jgi:GTPase SAR1 family protein
MPKGDGDGGRNEQTRKQWEQELPSGVKLGRTLEGHRGFVYSVAFDLGGRTLASGGDDGTVRLWEPATGQLVRTLEGHRGFIHSVAFDPAGGLLASGGDDGTVRLWEPATGQLVRTLEGHRRSIHSVAFDPAGSLLASGSRDGTVRLWEPATAQLVRTLEGRQGRVYSVAFDPAGSLLASGTRDGTVRLWVPASGELVRTLEGHTSFVHIVAFSVDGRLLASKSGDGTVRLWSCETWEPVAVIPSFRSSLVWVPGLAFHPTLPWLATVGSALDALEDGNDTILHLWELDLETLLGPTSKAHTPPQAVHYTTAKMVLVGDSGVGKTGLGWRLAHGEFKEHASTHGQQFWMLDQLRAQRADGTECEAILWDLAGQPDYRLTHALFLDDADLALVLFDPTDSRDPLHGVEFWVNQFKAGQAGRSRGQLMESNDTHDDRPMILVGARADRGEARLTPDELDAFCRQRGISGGYLATSAKEGRGLDELLRRMEEQIPWDRKTTTVTTVTFKRIKDYVLGLKENPEQARVIVSPESLRERLEQTDRTWTITDAEMMTAVGHLANYGYVRMLRTSKGEERILLAPELLNNLAASLVLEARRNPRGLGSLEEKRLLAGEFPFREMQKLPQEEQDILLDSAVLLFLEHNVCFRETDPLGGKSYLVFPELINLNKPVLEDEQPIVNGVAYTVSGAIGNVYASLVVLLGYTQTFTRTDQWRSQARYEVGDGLICGFRQEGERGGEMDLVLYFGTNVGRPVRTLFQGLFESFLAHHNLSVFRYEPVVCSKRHTLNRAVVRDHIRAGIAFAYCSQCGDKLTLPKADEPIQLTQPEHGKVQEQEGFAAQRCRFEQAIFQIMSYVESQKLPRPECFVSYAWGDKEQERWVERNLATDLQKAGIGIILDRWENAQVGASVARFVERIERCDRVLVVGTPLYRRKYENKDTSVGYVVAAEVDLISNRLLGTEAQKESVLPLLLSGEKTSSLPPLLHGRVYADFRNERAYFTTAFDLIRSLYKIAPNAPAVADLHESLQESEL